ncbi:MAG TPA: ABC transporter permease [Tepidisphaeraceae bacterium]|nr:ABC transporter permease [Tepidisphaeraceae bacterium]
MIFWTIVRLAMRSLVANKLRSALAMLGIIIGVWSVISALALAQGAQKKINTQMTSLGTNVVMVTPGQRGSNGVISGSQQNLKIADALAMLKLAEVTRVAPVVRGSVQAKRGNKNTRPSLLGTGPAYFAIREFQVQRGRIITDADCDGTARVAVLGPTTAQNLFGENFDDAIGQWIEIKGVHYRVVGVLKAKGDQGWFNPDDQIIIPYTTAMAQVLGVEWLNEVDLSATDESQLDAVQAKVTRLLRKRHRLAGDADNDFNVHNMAEIIRATSTISTILSVLLGGIAGISLFVGGIGVMNVMLVTVAERTREIGVRKAIGAKRRDILRQFLIESVVMSGTGGFIGVVLGVLTAEVVSAVQANIRLIVTPSSAMLALGFSAAVGIFFGYYPARRAAKLDPIEALRYE